MKKLAYLTIDDSPSGHFTQRVKFLERHGIVAVWFCLGRNLDQRNEEVIQAIQAGQIIANHTWSHLHFSEIDFATGKEEITRTEKLIDELYESAGVSRKNKWFRFPYFDRGGENEALYQEYLRENGYTHPKWSKITYQYFDSYRQSVDWPVTLDCMEWVYGSRHESQYQLMSMQEVQNRLLQDEPENGLGLYTDSADIILIHDHEKPDDRFTELVEFLMRQGVTFMHPAD